jgi:hypothetical protein
MRRPRFFLVMLALGLVAVLAPQLAFPGSALRSGWVDRAVLAAEPRPVTDRAGTTRARRRPQAPSRPRYPLEAPPVPRPAPTVRTRSETVGITVTVQPAPATAYSFAMEQNFPNPVASATTIRYELARATHVSIKLYSILGQYVATLVDDQREPGRYTVQWQARDGRGRKAAAGVYIYQLVAGGYVLNRKLVVQ